MARSKKKGGSAQESRARENLATTENAQPTDIEAVRINEMLYAKYYDASGATWWWNNRNSRLGGRTPHQVWLSETGPSAETIEMLQLAIAAPLMGHAT